MSSPLLHEGAQILCPHGGQVQPVVLQRRVRVDGQAVLTLGAADPVAGCPFVVAVKPQPCARVTWVALAQRVRADNQQVLLQSSTGQAYSAEGAPQGQANPVRFQTRVRGE